MPLTETIAPRPSALRFDRRRSPRWGVPGTAVAIRTAGDRFGLVHRLESIDCSAFGMGAEVAEAVAVGTAVLVGFESARLGHRQGIVCRCAPCDGGYRIAIRFEHRSAA
ncbi:MAG: PilZ domain-containing protein [Phycisphaerales bacterium]|nr:PilZ domain-containing protein [Phycisphaerales bacterium]